MSKSPLRTQPVNAKFRFGRNSRETLHLRYEAKGLMRLYINITITILDILRRPAFYWQRDM
jgi:hypothetical protein